MPPVPCRQGGGTAEAVYDYNVPAHGFKPSEGTNFRSVLPASGRCPTPPGGHLPARCFRYVLLMHITDCHASGSRTRGTGGCRHGRQLFFRTSRNGARGGPPAGSVSPVDVLLVVMPSAGCPGERPDRSPCSSPCAEPSAAACSRSCLRSWPVSLFAARLRAQGQGPSIR